MYPMHKEADAPISLSDLAGIQYSGVAGDSHGCLNALMRLIQCGDLVGQATLLTAGSAHCLLVTCDPGDQIAIKSGFGSGYGGTGPHALADALLLLHASNIEVQEVEVPKAVLDRLDESALTRADIALIEQTRAVRPSRWTEYVVAIHGVEGFDKSIWRRFKPVMPWAIIDARITDLALAFFSAPDKAIMDGFRRLEDLVRKRTGLSEHGYKLFSQAFTGDRSKLHWQDVSDGGEQNGRAHLFTAAFMAFRNPRAHREPSSHVHDPLAEFLLLNQLFILEREAVERPQESDTPNDAAEG